MSRRAAGRILVRRARHADLDRLVEFMVAMEDAEARFSPDLAARRIDRRLSRRRFARNLRGGSTRWWLACGTQSVIGVLGIDLHTARHRYAAVRRYAYLHSLFVEPAWRGAGAARTLIRRALTWARRRGAGQARLEMAIGNEAARGLYGSFGFVPREQMFTRDLVAGNRP